MTLSIICVKGKKIGDSLLVLEEGCLFSIYPDTFYPRNITGYWALKQIGNYYKIIRFLQSSN